MRGLLFDWIECVSNNGMCNLAPTTTNKLHITFTNQTNNKVSTCSRISLIQSDIS